MLHLLAQLQKKLQLDLKTNNTENHQKTELYGNPTTKDLKKPHSSRQVGEAETQRLVERCGDAVWCREAVKWAVPHLCVTKLRRDASGSQDPSPWPDRSAQGSSNRNINPHNFWL